MTWEIREGDCIEQMRAMEECSVDSIVTDPPYGLSREPDVAEVLTHWLEGDDYQHRGGGFMGQSWDSFVPGPAYWREAFRVLKPGAHMLAFGGTRTYDLLAIAVRLAGFEVRDSVMWLYGSGFPKALNVSKAIDKSHRRDYVLAAVELGLDVPGNSLHDWTTGEHAPGDQWWERFKAVLSPEDWQAIERAVVGRRTTGIGAGAGAVGYMADSGNRDVTAPATADAEHWRGWGTALKPGHEPIVVARKPLDGTVAANVLEHGTGALNIEGCRIEGPKAGGSGSPPLQFGGANHRPFHDDAQPREFDRGQGRWPANVTLSHTEDCVLVGAAQVASNGHFPAARGPSGYGSAVEDSNGGGLHGQGDLDERHFAGETVESWACVPGCPVRTLDEQSGERGGSGPASGPSLTGQSRSVARGQFNGVDQTPFYGDRGGASRFFYCAKASANDREAGLLGLVPCTSCGELSTTEHPAPTEKNPDATKRCRRNAHPTVKPIELIRWLTRLVTPPGGVILDMFAGSGTHGCAAELEGFDFIGIEREPMYAAIARARMDFWAKHPTGLPIEKASACERVRRAKADSGQLSLEPAA